MSDQFRERVLVSAEGLQQQIAGGAKLVLLDVAGGDEPPRAQGIPGAIRVDPATAFAGPGGGLKGARPLPDPQDLQRNVRLWGIDPDSIVILYDDKSALQAARGWWVLKWAGLRDVRLLDGGLRAWVSAGLPIIGLNPAPGGGGAQISPGGLETLDADGADRFARQEILVDARAATAFQGDPAARTGGHIPGSINLPASGNLAADGRFAPAEALHQRFAPLLRLPGRRIGVTCGSGVSAAHDIAALASIGVDAALFPGSWSAWSADPNRRVAYGDQ